MSIIAGGRRNLYVYDYDTRGNIISVVNQVGSTTYNTTYEYDELNRLIRENNEELGKSYFYIYNNSGNIRYKYTFEYTTEPSNSVTTSLESIDEYSYNNTNSNDRLSAYNGSLITYDEIGNPIQYYNGYTFTWLGRELVGATNGSYTLSFSYDDTGLRQTKTVNGDTTIYSYNGSLLLSEQNSERYIVYIYDENGSPVGFMCRRGEDLVHGSLDATNFDVYWFEKNLQGDVVAIRNESGQILVTYTYDAWGNFTTTYINGGEDTTVVYNTIFYRSYYYDAELELYYLTTRCYDANIGRFISADDISYLGAGGIPSYNLYAYCENNPVMGYDPYGTFNFWGFLKGVGRVISGVAAVAVGVAVCVAGAPVAMIVVASVTITAGTLTTVNGAADIQESITGDNFVRDTVFDGDQTAYDVYSGITDAITILGTAICGNYLRTKNATKLYRSVCNAEANDFYSTGKLSEGTGQMQGKFFATTKHDAKIWGKKLGSKEIITIRVPNHSLTHNSVSYFPRLDYIGPAYYFSDLTYLNSIIF